MTLAFVLCDGNRTFVVSDLDRHRAVASFPIPEGSDVVKFDPGFERVYVACSSGHRVYAPEEQEAGKPLARMVVYEALP